ncbi:MAG: hypothetical protein ACRDHL_10895 [Candidatus Promineifilaceae bacterium]
MNPLQTQTGDYWASHAALTDSDVEQIYNHFLEVERPQTVEQIARVIIAGRVAEEQNKVRQVLSGRKVYRPMDAHEVGDEVVFRALKYAHGKVTATREGYDPRHGQFTVIAVDINGRTREFASSLPGEHALNSENGAEADPAGEVDVDELVARFGPAVAQGLGRALAGRPEFVRLGRQWFVKELLAEANIGHLHLAEAVLEVNEGAPLATPDILVHLEMDAGLDPAVREFSLNYALSQDERFDEVGAPGKVAWALRRLEPEGVRVVPERLRYEPIGYDRSLLSPQLVALERELDDEWSDLPSPAEPQATILSLTYPHRWAGTLPLSARTRPLLPTGTSPRQRVLLVDEARGQEMVAWVVQEGRYILGLADWYQEHKIPIGGFISLKPGPETGVVLIGFDERNPRREWIRLANVVDNRLTFENERRSIGCGYDDLMIVGTDYSSALDAFARRIEANNWSLASLLNALFAPLAALNPQDSVHTKTLYSAANMFWRLPPGPLFAELVRQPAFRPVGDHYWQMEPGRN